VGSFLAFSDSLKVKSKSQIQIYMYPDKLRRRGEIITLAQRSKKLYKDTLQSAKRCVSRKSVQLILCL